VRATSSISASLRPSDRWSLVVALAFGPVGPRERGRRESSLASHVPGSRCSSVAWSSGSVQSSLRRPCPSCCTETERDFLSFLALEPSRGLGCGYVGLIVSSWLTLAKSAHRCGGGAAAGPRAPQEGVQEPRGRLNGGGCVCWHGCGWERRSDRLLRLREVLVVGVDCASDSQLLWVC